jgi:hypothetical protein
VVVKCRGLCVRLPLVRSSDTPNFSKMTVPRAGSIGRPAPYTAEAELRNLQYMFIDTGSRSPRHDLHILTFAGMTSRAWLIETDAVLEDVAGFVHAYPTLAEVTHEVGLAALGRPLHL